MVIWASTLKSATVVLEKMVAAGLTEMNFSTGDSHVEFVPIENIIIGSYVSRSLGLSTSIMVETSGACTVTKETLITHPLYQELLGQESDVDLVIIESPWISMYEGHDRVECNHDQMINLDTLHTRGGCDSILSTIVATPQRELFACCGIISQQIPEVKLGILDDRAMKDMYDDARGDFLKIWLSVDGPEKIVAWAAQFDSSIKWENRYSHQCDICQFMYQDERVRNVIAENYESAMPNILLKYAIRNRV